MPAMLDVLIGIITVYLVFALACTATVEAINSWLNTRSKMLGQAVQEFLHGGQADGDSEDGYSKAFFSHPLIQALSKGKDGRPSYIDPALVAKVVTELAGVTANDINGPLQQLPDGRVKTLLLSLATEAENDVDKFRTLVENHYDATMARASGWFKRHAQMVTLIVSTVIVLAGNVDTVKLFNSLSQSPAERQALVNLAAAQLGKGQPVAGGDTNALQQTSNAAASTAQAMQNVTSAGIVLGWHGDRPTPAAGKAITTWDCLGWTISKILGLLISLFAISLGAPFWFDTLSRFMQVRSAGGKR